MKTPRVSIILPVYNAAAYVAGAVKSVLNQSFADFELVIINDGSTDNSLEIVKGFKDDRIKIVENEINLGLQLTLNKGLKLSRSEYIARIDADDEWIGVDKLKEQVDFLDNNKSCVLIGTGASVINESGEEIYQVSLPRTDKEIRQKMLKANQFFHSSIMMRVSALDKVGFYNEDADSKHIEDYDLWLRLGKIGEFYNLPIVALRYRDIGSSVSRQNVIGQLKKNIRLIKKYRYDYPGYIFALVHNNLKLVIYGYGKLLSFRKYIFRLKNKNKKNYTDNRKKILIWESLSHIAGGQRVLLNILPYLKDDFIVTVIAPSPGTFSKALDEMGVSVKFINTGTYNAGKKNIFDILKYLLLFPLGLIKSFLLVKKNDLIYINSTRVLPGGLLGGLIFKKPVVWHNHSLISDGKTKALLNILTKFSSLKKMIAVSNSVSNQFPQLKNKTIVLYNGVDLDKFKPGKESKSNNIMVVGDLMPTKGQDVLIRALASFNNVDYKLKIVGSARAGMELYETSLKELVKELNLEKKIEFLGRRSDVDKLLPDMSLLVLPATGFEACPMVVLEAMACGVPVIVSDLGGTTEIVQDDYVGYLFRAGDEKDLEKKLNKFFNLDYKKIIAMKLNCRKEAELKYDLKDNAIKINSVIKNILS
ncbi:MAG: glycosyltransferase [Candidatus Falkowbacteria bacterium]